MLLHEGLMVVSGQLGVNIGFSKNGFQHNFRIRAKKNATNFWEKTQRSRSQSGKKIERFVKRFLEDNFKC